MREFEQVMQSLLSGFNLDLFKYRFIDVECIERLGGFAVFSYAVSWEDAVSAQQYANKQYRKWFD